MAQKLFFLRHAHTQLNPGAHAKLWALSDVGKQQSIELTRNEHFRDAEVIYCSEEKKTDLTIRHFARHFNIPICTHPGLNEIHFSDNHPYDRELFVLLKKQCFKNLDYSEGLIESFNSGLRRFRVAVQSIRNDNPMANILIVSHGTILSLYFAFHLQILDRGEILFQRWQKLRYCAWGLESGGKIMRDLK